MKTIGLACDHAGFELKEPLQKGQTAPKNENQQRQQDKPKKNNKGMKM